MATESSWRTPAVILVAGVLVLILAFGIRTSFGIFMVPISGDLGWGREIFGFALALQNLVWGASQPFAGAIADRWGSGRVIGACGAMYAAGVLVMAGAATPLGMTVGAGIIVGVALSGTSFPVILAVIGRAVPEEKRSFYLGLGAAGGSSGQLLMVPAAQGLLLSMDWAMTLVWLAAMSALMVPLAVALVSDPRRMVGISESAKQQSISQAIQEAGGHRGYWLLNAGFFVCGFHVMFIASHLPAFVVDKGLAPALGALALTLVGLANIIGSYLSGVLGGRYSKRYLLSFIYFARAVAFLFFILLPVTEVSVVVFAFVLGLLWLSTVPLTSGLVAQIFGPRYMATLFGIVFFSHQVGSFLGAWLGGYFYDLTGSYDVVWWASVALGVFSGLIHWPIDERPVARLAAPAAE
ncbi:MAG: MFS transporter [Rhodospirillales bacterium]|nr:MAG: MFS transporter [Rhodospirillales bacterium]